MDHTKKQTYTFKEAFDASLKYFNGDELAANVFVSKYALFDSKNNAYYESTPDDMHKRLAKEFARIESKYINGLSEKEIYNYLSSWEIVPQGSPMAGIGNTHQLMSISNCFVSGTNVFTSNRGVVPIEDVKIGDETITHNGNVKKVIQLHKNKLNNRKLFNIKCYRTPSFSVTDNHKFFSISQEQIKWRNRPQFNSLEYLRVGDYIQIPNNTDNGIASDIDISSLFDNKFNYGTKKYDVIREGNSIKLSTIYEGRVRDRVHKHFIPSIIKADEDFAYFLGLWYSDGCIFGENRTQNENEASVSIRGITFTFGAHEQDIIDFVVKYLQKLDIFYDLNNNKEIDGTVQVIVHSPILGYAFDILFGMGPEKKQLNNFIYNWPKKLVEKLLYGLLGSDMATTQNGNVRVVLANKLLIKSFYHLFRSRNIFVGYSETETTARLDFDNNYSIRNINNKSYSDNRILDELNNSTTEMVIIDGNIFTQIVSKEFFNESPEYVYTLGIEDDHSYAIEGLISMNCFVIDSPSDSFGGIHKSDQEEAQIFKRRGGVGLDISHIRPKGLATENAAKTTDGIGVFMERFSNTCREVAQSGRRGALMLTISVHHPEILTFIKIKRDLKKVTGANISIRVTDEFMKAVESNDKVDLRFPVDSGGKVCETIDAQYIWNEIIASAHSSAEPGVLFWDTVKNTTPSDVYKKEGFESISTNPCIIGDSLIAVADGRNAISIKQLAEEGNNIPVYSHNIKTGQVEIKMGRNPRKTGQMKEVWKLILDDDSLFYATPDHKILLTNKKYVELKDLKSGATIETIKNADNKTIMSYKVSSIAFERYDDVYNITVDDNNNYYVITSKEDVNFIASSGICVKNCGEIILSANDACRLLLVNALKFVSDPFTDKASFDFKKFNTVCRIAQRLMDDIVDLEIECVDRIIEKIKSDPEDDFTKSIELTLWQKIRDKGVAGRRTGTGLTAIGDTLAALNISYGADDAHKTVGSIYKQLALACYEETIELAKQRGAFQIFSLQKECEHKFIKKIINELPIEVQTKYKKYGRRNIALTTTAPAGSVSILTQTTSGIEPAFMLKYDRWKKINPGEADVKIDRVDALGDSWQKFVVYHHGLKKWMDVSGKENLDDSPYYKSTSNEINWLNRVKCQAAAQEWICHSISSTVNIPSDTSIDTVKQIYMEGWRYGCKGITVYRDGSRDGVLTSSDVSTEKNKFGPHSAPKRPEALQCEVHRVKIKDEDWTVFLSLMDGNVYEIIGGLSKYVTIPKKVKEGRILKIKKGNNSHYNFSSGKDDDLIEIKDLVNIFENPTYGSLTRMLSLALRHGASIQYVVEQLQKGDKDSDMFTFSKVISRVLKTKIKDGTKVNSICELCGSSSIEYREGCATCMSCGSSKCG